MERTVKYEEEAFEKAYAWLASSPSYSEED